MQLVAVMQIAPLSLLNSRRRWRGGGRSGGLKGVCVRLGTETEPFGWIFTARMHNTYTGEGGEAVA